MEHGLPVLQPVKMKDPAFVEELASYKADLQVVVAFRMLPEVVWAMPKYGTFNVHAALLPKYRGAAPINWTVINGETETGVTTFFLDHDIDTGRIIDRKTFQIPDDADVEYVYDGLMVLGAELALETVDKVIAGDGVVESKEQSEYAGDAELPVAPKIFKETCEINWNQPAKKVYDFVRGLSPYPGAWGNVVLNDKELMLKVFKTQKTDKATSLAPGELFAEKGHLYVSCADSLLEILHLQQSGKKRMSAKDFINGQRL